LSKKNKYSGKSSKPKKRVKWIFLLGLVFLAGFLAFVILRPNWQMSFISPDKKNIIIIDEISEGDWNILAFGYKYRIRAYRRIKPAGEKGGAYVKEKLLDYELQGGHSGVGSLVESITPQNEVGIEWTCNSRVAVLSTGGEGNLYLLLYFHDAGATAYRLSGEMANQQPDAVFEQFSNQNFEQINKCLVCGDDPDR
jgi:hypothetical protein